MKLIGDGLGADPDYNLTHVPLDQDPPPTDDDRSNGIHDGDGAANVDENDDDEDDGESAGPTVEAHVELGKKSCECHVTPYYRNRLNYIYSVQGLPPRYCHRNRTTRLHRSHTTIYL